MENTKQPLNAWKTIWLEPRNTMKNILEAEPNTLFILFFLGSLASSIDQAILDSYGDIYEGTLQLFTAIVLIALVFMFLNYFVYAPIVYFVGDWLGGKGTLKGVRYAIAYSFIPYIIGILLVFIPHMLITGMDLFTSNPISAVDPFWLTIFWIIAIIEIVLGIWGIFMSIKCLAESLQISSWRALGVILISAFLLFILIMFLMVFSISFMQPDFV